MPELTGVESRTTLQFLPTNALGGAIRKFNFNVPSLNLRTYPLIDQLFLEISVSLLKENGDALDEGTEAQIINNQVNCCHVAAQTAFNCCLLLPGSFHH